MSQAGLIYIYALNHKFNKTSNSTSYRPTQAIILRAEEPHIFDKFGAAAESDGENMLWISSGWANEEGGVVWSYNVRHGFANLRKRVSLIFQTDDDLELSNRKDDEQDPYEVATIFAKGVQPKVLFFLFNSP
jgi:hypothetical protein